MKIPSELQVGGVTYQVRWDLEARQFLANEGNNGYCNKQSLCLSLNPDQTRVGQTFLHEVVHAIDFEYCACSLTEAQVDTISHGMMQVLRQFGIEFTLEE